MHAYSVAYMQRKLVLMQPWAAAGSRQCRLAYGCTRNSCATYCLLALILSPRKGLGFMPAAYDSVSPLRTTPAKPSLTPVVPFKPLKPPALPACWSTSALTSPTRHIQPDQLGLLPQHRMRQRFNHTCCTSHPAIPHPTPCHTLLSLLFAVTTLSLTRPKLTTSGCRGLAGFGARRRCWRC